MFVVGNVGKTGCVVVGVVTTGIGLTIGAGVGVTIGVGIGVTTGVGVTIGDGVGTVGVAIGAGVVVAGSPVSVEVGTKAAGGVEAATGGGGFEIGDTTAFTPSAHIPAELAVD